MIHTKAKIKTVTEQIVTALTCDLCHRRFESASVKDDTAKWRTDLCRFDMTTVAYQSLEGGPWIHQVTDQIAFQICPECFVTRLVPWIKEQGAEATADETPGD